MMTQYAKERALFECHVLETALDNLVSSCASLHKEEVRVKLQSGVPISIEPSPILKTLCELQETYLTLKKQLEEK